MSFNLKTAFYKISESLSFENKFLLNITIIPLTASLYE